MVWYDLQNPLNAKIIQTQKVKLTYKKTRTCWNPFNSPRTHYWSHGLSQLMLHYQLCSWWPVLHGSETCDRRKHRWFWEFRHLILTFHHRTWCRVVRYCGYTQGCCHERSWLRPLYWSRDSPCHFSAVWCCTQRGCKGRGERVNWLSPERVIWHSES